MDELQEMKAQMALLNEQLSHEKIVTDRLLRDVTRRQVDKWHNVARKDCIEAFLILCSTYLFYRMEFSGWFIGATVLVAIVQALSASVPLPRIKREAIASDDLLMVARRMRTQRKMYERWISARFVLGIGWFIGLIVEMMRWYHGTEPWVYVVCSLMWIVLAVFAITKDRRRYKGYLREMDEVIAQIEE